MPNSENHKRSAEARKRRNRKRKMSLLTKFQTALQTNEEFRIELEKKDGKIRLLEQQNENLKHEATNDVCNLASLRQMHRTFFDVISERSTTRSRDALFRGAITEKLTKSDRLQQQRGSLCVLQQRGSAVTLSVNGLKVGKILGRGRFGQVYRGSFLDVFCVLKKTTSFLVKLEFFMLNELWNGPESEWKSCFPAPYGLFRGQLVMTLAPGMTLALAVEADDFLWPAIVKKMVSAIHFMHGRGVLHLDLHAENVMVNQNCSCVIVDFGKSSLRDFPVTLNLPNRMKIDYRHQYVHVAPEDIDGESSTTASDVYSLGILLRTISLAKCCPAPARSFLIKTSSLCCGPRNKRPDTKLILQMLNNLPLD